MKQRLKGKIFFAIFFLITAGFFFGVNAVQAAGVLKQITATPSDVTASANSSYTVSFVTATNIAAGGKILIEFPAGFDVNGADNLLDYTDIDLSDDGVDLTLGGSASGVTWGASISGQIITITSGTGTIASASAVVVEIGNNATSGEVGDKQIVNTSTIANNYQVIVTTKNSSDTILDGPTNTLYFQIFASHSETDIDGIYYLRSDPQTHYQNDGDIIGSYGRDIGTFSRIAPSSKENRHCTGWVQFYFDENGTYTQTNQINNIYYHTWWKTADDQGILGYNKTGSYDFVTNENFTVNALNSPNKVGDYYLYAGKKILSSPASVLGNAVYNFVVKLRGSGQTPSIISYSDQSSFIIINLPDDTTLLALDSDSDGLSDYDELFTYYTNPYDSDTDDDGYDDKYEVDNSLDPVDPESIPIFGKWLLKQYNGVGAGDAFGHSVASILDIDGDGKEDILVGAYGANPGGILGAGSAYIFSSATGDLIRQYDGVAKYDFFGSSVASISDIDGDGKEDILVGAYSADPGGLLSAGSAYIYSSTGSTTVPLKQYDGVVAGGYFGYSVSSISDIDGDGKEDILVGAYRASSGGLVGAGSVYIYSSTGSTTVPLKQYNGAVAGDYFGYSVSSISDIDGDGKEDILVGSPYADPGGLLSAGSAYVYSSTGSTTVPLKQYDGVIAGNNFGSSVASILDIDGDGKEDIVVGANIIGFGGYVYLYSSITGNLIEQYNGGTNDAFGYSVSSISDIDGDGKGDVLVGAPYADPNEIISAGSVYIYSSTGYILNQSWAKGSSEVNAFDLDDYFTDSNNFTVPARKQTVTYTASTADNPYIDVLIGADNVVSFSQPAEWAGTEAVVFTATDSTGLSSVSNAVSLTVSGTESLNAPTIGTATLNSCTSITWSWTDNSEIEESYMIDYITGAGTDVDDLNPQTTKSSSGNVLTYQATGLVPNTLYSIVVHAYNSDVGESEASDTIDATTSVCGGGMPAQALVVQIVQPMTPAETTAKIAEIKQQLIALITQLIQMLTQQVALMQK